MCERKRAAIVSDTLVLRQLQPSGQLSTRQTTEEGLLVKAYDLGRAMARLKWTPCTSNRNHKTLIKKSIAILLQTFPSQTTL